MANTIRSHAFFVGNLQDKVALTNIDTSVWEAVIVDESTYSFLCSYFHSSHVDAMVEAKGQNRPKFLKDVTHYRLRIDKLIPFSVFNQAKDRLDVLDNYNLNIKGLHIYCFPLDMTLFAIEIDDSGSDFNDLTLAHALIRELPSRWTQFNEEFKVVLDPITKLFPERKESVLALSGNKLKLFQIMLVDQANWTDEHLYEMGTCSPVDIVNTDHYLSPSKEYYESIMKENTIAPFKTWKSLSLMDSFTALIKCNESFSAEEWENDKTRWIDSYYRMIFLRVVIQKTFLSTQNVLYRLNRSNANIIRDLARMEQYYFYDNISYNFLPDMLNKHMEKGMAINDEKTELSSQIKERDSKNTNTLTGILSVFAIFSICYDIYTIVRIITHHDSALLLAILSLFATLSIVIIIVRLIRRN